MTSVYISGHHPSVLKSHSWRDAQNSAAYLLPYLTSPSMTMLDVGCGPGTITIDLAGHLPQGHVWGIDPSEEVIQKARDEAERKGVKNVTFEVGDILDLGATRNLPTDAKFDVVHAHQVIQHIPNPIESIKAMRNALKPNGYLALRCVDFETFVWWPTTPEMDRWKSLFQQVSNSDGCEQNLARRMISLCMQAGFRRDQINATAASWCYTGPEQTKWWGDLWSERVTHSTFPEKAIARGFATKEELQQISEAWKKWGTCEDAWFGMLHSEVVCKIPAES